MSASGRSPGRAAAAWLVTGQVQGVGFRPFVWRLATELGLAGSVRNTPAGVRIDAAGAPPAIAELRRRLREEAPPLARIDGVEEVPPDPTAAGAAAGFRIEASEEEAGGRGRVTVDAATCPACLGEILDPADRRHRHGLSNCTACGPRYSIVRDLPYDRARTTMAAFPMCDACRAEYEDPADRRFHAQPVCCPDCGPRVRLTDAEGGAIPGDPYARAAELLAEGGILAMKGVGGFHLVVDARDPDAVLHLRREKRRDAKPFAVMVPDLAAARAIAALSPAGERALASPAAPVVLAPYRGGLARGVNGPSRRAGVMFPGNPMQHLLLREAGGPLVMTSGNLAGEPLVTDEATARARLSFADGFLAHDRPIERAVDDSVLIDGPLGLVPVRRARGFAPAPIRLPVPSPRPGLAFGGDLKSVVALVDGATAMLSPHLGDLEHPLAFERYRRTIDDMIRLHDVDPEWFAADLHPDYLSTRHATRLAAAAGAEPVRIQHHHAHLAALLAEHGRSDRILALACDGVGHGADGSAWGGEVLAGDLLDFERLGRLRPLRLPGGDAAARELDRPALSWLFDVHGAAAADHPAAARVCPDPERRRTILGMLARDVACPPSSGLGRLFDAAAALVGVATENRFEAEAGIALEAAAAGADAAAPAPARGLVPVTEGGLLEIDPRPLLPRLLAVRDDAGPGAAAGLFHEAIADALLRAARSGRARTGLATIGLTGGVFLNPLLTERLVGRLSEDGFAVLLPREVPPGDGGLALGQAAVTAARANRTRAR